MSLVSGDSGHIHVWTYSHATLLLQAQSILEELSGINIIEMSGKVFLWGSPRTLSTAFTRAMLNLDDCKVFMEPYLDAYYSGPDRTSQRFIHESPNPTLTFENTTEIICKDYSEKTCVFCKEMAYYFEGKLDELRSEKLKDFQHTFLIRDPKKSIPSLYRVNVNSRIPTWRRFDSNECGIRQQYELYQFIKTTSEKSPIIIHVDDLLKDPERVLKYFCDHTGLTYKEGMSIWEPGPVPEWEDWAEFVGAVFNSSGIGRLSKPDLPSNDNPSFKLPEIVTQAIQDSTWYYEQLYQDRIQFL